MVAVSYGIFKKSDFAIMGFFSNKKKNKRFFKSSYCQLYFLSTPY